MDQVTAKLADCRELVGDEKKKQKKLCNLPTSSPTPKKVRSFFQHETVKYAA
jgi:hypothetical protein